MRTLGQYMLGSGATFGYGGVSEFGNRLEPWLTCCLPQLLHVHRQCDPVRRIANCSGSLPPRPAATHDHGLECLPSLPAHPARQLMTQPRVPPPRAGAKWRTRSATSSRAGAEGHVIDMLYIRIPRRRNRMAFGSREKTTCKRWWC